MHDRVFLPPDASSKALGCSKIEEASAVFTPQAGDSLGMTRRAPAGVIPATEGISGAAERAPLRGGTREAALSQAVPRKRRRPGDAGSLRRSTSGSLVCETSEEFSTAEATPAFARHEQRHEMSEPIGLGRSSPRERSRREAPSRGKMTSAWPLALDISAGRAPKGASPSAAQGRDRKVAITRVAAPAGDRGRGHAGFW
jgi:hypothetical protein